MRPYRSARVPCARTLRVAVLTGVTLCLGCGVAGATSPDDAGRDARDPDGHTVADGARPDAFGADEGVLDGAGPPDAPLALDGGDAGTGSGVDLRSAAAFAVLSGSTATSTGLTTITGDVGISPGSALTGFPPGIIVGATHIGDAVTAQAMIDLTTAYNDAAARSFARVTVDGNLGGRTLAPGLYTSGSSLEITSGDLTLDGGGDANAVWIFQMGSTFTMTSGRQVFLTGSGRAANVYWEVGSSATIGSTAVIVGNLMADQSITLDTGATLTGRALTRIGAVTLDSNMVTLP